MFFDLGAFKVNMKNIQLNANPMGFPDPFIYKKIRFVYSRIKRKTLLNLKVCWFPSIKLKDVCRCSKKGNQSFFDTFCVLHDFLSTFKKRNTIFRKYIWINVNRVNVLFWGYICKVSDNNFLLPAISVTNCILFWRELHVSLNKWEVCITIAWPIPVLDS